MALDSFAEFEKIGTISEEIKYNKSNLICHLPHQRLPVPSVPIITLTEEWVSGTLRPAEAISAYNLPVCVGNVNRKSWQQPNHL